MIDMMRNRRSVREFTGKMISDGDLEVLKEALLRSPSSRSINPWEFILVNDQSTLQELARCKPHGASFLSGAALAVVILADTGKSDTCVEDCSIAAITLQYMAEFLGLASCWCQVRLRSHAEGRSAEEYVRQLMGIPADFLVECIVAIGHPAGRPSPQTRDNLEWGKLWENRFG
jgi:nitroreductase